MKQFKISVFTIVVLSNLIAFISSSEWRNLFQFGSMIGDVTGVSLYSAYSNFNGYGCWCGNGGFGDPVDAIDSCCKVHDECYDTVEQVYDCSPKVFNMYDYEAQLGSAKCNDPEDSCDYRICKCDKDAAECFYRNINTFNKTNQFSNSQKLNVCKCPPGTVLLSNTDTECQKCPKKYYNEKEGQVALKKCLLCPTGHICPNEGTVVPQICPKGTYEYDRLECYNCPVRYYQPIEGGAHSYSGMGTGTYCKYCPAGYICPEPGLEAPKQICPKGTYEFDRLECRECRAGYYQPIEGGTHNYVGIGTGTYCKSCPAGYICPEPGLEAPKQICPKGTYASKGIECVKCRVGYYQDQEGATGCKSCPSGFSCPNEGTVNPIPK
jgi:secretory phospholipase A2